FGGRLSAAATGSLYLFCALLFCATGATATRRTCGAPAQAAARRVAAVSDKDLKRISANEIRFRQ
ncbi:MAG: hypothetical protein QF797_18550, partial [Alphaproteobacteria bacterium]|nr:hypothetical protein [Alphaproteobacteria bacterium]